MILRLREFYDRIGGGFTVFAAALMAALIAFAIGMILWAGPTKGERISDLEKRVAQLEAERP